MPRQLVTLSIFSFLWFFSLFSLHHYLNQSYFFRILFFLLLLLFFSLESLESQYIKSGERSLGLIPAIPSNDNNKVYSASISIAVEARSTSDICPAYITLFILDREGTQCIVLSGSWNWEQGSCKASASYMLR